MLAWVVIGLSIWIGYSDWSPAWMVAVCPLAWFFEYLRAPARLQAVLKRDAFSALAIPMIAPALCFLLGLGVRLLTD